MREQRVGVERRVERHAFLRQATRLGERSVYSLPESVNLVLRVGLSVSTRPERHRSLPGLSRKRRSQLESVQQLLKVAVVGGVDRGEQSLIILGRLAASCPDEFENLRIGQISRLGRPQVERGARAKKDD